MQQPIRQALHALVGLPLWGARRTADLESFHFGAQREVPVRGGGSSIVGTYALHVQCAWRLVGPSGIIVGGVDRYYPSGDDPYKDAPDFDWGRPGQSRCDERIAAFFATAAANSLVVEEVEADSVGGIRLFMSEGHSLDVFPDNSLSGEHWRLLQPATQQEHFVVTGSGIES